MQDPRLLNHPAEIVIGLAMHRAIEKNPKSFNQKSIRNQRMPMNTLVFSREEFAKICGALQRLDEDSIERTLQWLQQERYIGSLMPSHINNREEIFSIAPNLDFSSSVYKLGIKGLYLQLERNRENDFRQEHSILAKIIRDIFLPAEPDIRFSYAKTKKRLSPHNSSVINLMIGLLILKAREEAEKNDLMQALRTKKSVLISGPLIFTEQDLRKIYESIPYGKKSTHRLMVACQQLTELCTETEKGTWTLSIEKVRNLRFKQHEITLTCALTENSYLEMFLKKDGLNYPIKIEEFINNLNKNIPITEKIVSSDDDLVMSLEQEVQPIGLFSNPAEILIALYIYNGIQGNSEKFALNFACTKKIQLPSMRFLREEFEKIYREMGIHTEGTLQQAVEQALNELVQKKYITLLLKLPEKRQELFSVNQDLLNFSSNLYNLAVKDSCLVVEEQAWNDTRQEHEKLITLVRRIFEPRAPQPKRSFVPEQREIIEILDDEQPPAQKVPRTMEGNNPPQTPVSLFNIPYSFFDPGPFLRDQHAFFAANPLEPASDNFVPIVEGFTPQPLSTYSDSSTSYSNESSMPTTEESERYTIPVDDDFWDFLREQRPFPNSGR